MYSTGLNGSLYMGANSLNAQQLAIQTIGNNLSNINTPGYARQRANLVESAVVTNGGGFGLAKMLESSLTPAAHAHLPATQTPSTHAPGNH